MKLLRRAMCCVFGLIVVGTGCSTSAPLGNAAATTTSLVTTARQTTAPTKAAVTTTVTTKPAVATTPAPATSTATPTTTKVATPTAAPTTHAAATTAALPPASVPLNVAQLAGTYFGHDRNLIIVANGDVHFDERSFVFCSDNPAPPCDGNQNGQLTNGIQVDLRIQSGTGTTAKALVTTSTDPTIPVGTAVTLTRTPTEVQFSGGPLEGLFFCSANAAVGECGA